MLRACSKLNFRMHCLASYNTHFQLYEVNGKLLASQAGKNLRVSLVQVEDEMDELLLLEDDIFDVDPEALPRRLLTDFAIYNAEVRCL